MPDGSSPTSRCETDPFPFGTTFGRSPRYLVHSVLHAELVHVLARKSARDLGFVRQSLGLFLRLGIRTLPLSEAALLRTAHWTCRGLSGYDATFVALAEDVGGRWLTADERAAKVAGPRSAQTLRAWAVAGSS